VDLAAALAADLAGLSRAIDDPEFELETDLRALIAHLQDAVESYLGLRMTMTIEDRRLSFATYAGGVVPTDIGSSLRLALSAVAATDGGSFLVFFAAAPGAFVDLAADLSYALQVDLSDLVLDEDGLAGPGAGGINGLPAWSDVNRAVGVLIGRGHTLESAREELRRLADLGSGDLHHAAATVLDGIGRPDIGPKS
jgi:hypothetical protein